MSTHKQYKGICRAPRWMGLSSAIKNSAFALGLDCKLDSEKGFITESVRFLLTGEEAAINRFSEWYRSLGAQE